MDVKNAPQLRFHTHDIRDPSPLALLRVSRLLALTLRPSCQKNLLDSKIVLVDPGYTLGPNIPGSNGPQDLTRWDWPF